MIASSLVAHVWLDWQWEPVTIAGLAVASTLYAVGLRRLGRQRPSRRAVPAWHTWYFVAGVAVLVVALLSPFDEFADHLFWVHMVQHLLLVLVAAPLLALAAPLVPMLWAFRRPTRRRIGRWWRRTPLAAIAHVLTIPIIALALQVTAMSVWHLPALYQAALRHPAVHALEHATLFGTALLFWWVVFQPTGRRRAGYGAAILYVFVSGLQGAALGAILTFAHVVLFPLQSATAGAWGGGLTPLEDQQLAGLIMWVPGGFVYLIVASVLFIHWIGRDEQPAAIVGDPTNGHRSHHVVLHRTRERHEWLTVLAIAAFLSGSAFLTGCQREAAAYMAPFGNAKAGKADLASYGCGSCHVIPGVRGANGFVRPPLIQFARRSYIAGEAPNTYTNLVRWIEMPQSIEPTADMPNLGIAERQARDMAAYLYTLK